MANLVDLIEEYLKNLVKQSPTGIVEIQRQEIAQRFTCAPSQINYVLSTRFTSAHGYVIESRRGGGGYLRITKLPATTPGRMIRMMEQEMISQQVGEGLLASLFEAGFLTERELVLLKAVVDREAIPLKLPERDLVRGAILRALVKAIIKNNI